MCDFVTQRVTQVPASKPLYGYKELGWRERALVSPAWAEYHWRRGQNQAENFHPDDRSGFHAYRTMTGLHKGWRVDEVCVKVALWGVVKMCEDRDGGGAGYCAQYAKIVGVVGYGEYSDKEECDKASRRYKVPVKYRKFK